jgi:hypothetical protein
MIQNFLFCWQIVGVSEEVGLPKERHEHGGRARHHALLRRAAHVPAGTLIFLFHSEDRDQIHPRKETNILKNILLFNTPNVHSTAFTSLRDHLPSCLAETNGLLFSQRLHASFSPRDRMPPFLPKTTCFLVS